MSVRLQVAANAADLPARASHLDPVLSRSSGCEISDFRAILAILHAPDRRCEHFERGSSLRRSLHSSDSAPAG